MVTFDSDQRFRFGLRSFEPTSAGEHAMQAVNYVETTVEWEQWAVNTDLSLTCHC